MNGLGVYLAIVGPSLLGCVIGWGVLALGKRKGWG